MLNVPKLDRTLGIRVSPEFMRRVKRAAKLKRRRPSDFARVAVEEAVEAVERESPDDRTPYPKASAPSEKWSVSDRGDNTDG